MPGTPRLCTYLAPEDMLCALTVADKNALLSYLGKHMAARHGLDPQEVTTALRRREQVGSTGLGSGFALPHARIAGLDGIRIVYARLTPGIDFAGADGQPVTDVLTILVPKQAEQLHLDLLAVAATMFADTAFRQRLRAATDAPGLAREFAAWPHAADR